MTLRRLRLVAFLGFLLLIAASVGVTFAALQTQRADALVINLAGRQRMLIQKMTLEVLGVQADADPLYRQQLRATEIVYFEQTLAALIAGGQAPHNGGTPVTLPPTRDPEILAQLQVVRAAWEEMDQAIHTVLAAEPRSAEMNEAVDTVMRLSPVILSQMDEAVRLYEAEAARKVARAQAVQVAFLALAVVLLAIAWPLTERRVLAPIAQLGDAARRIGEGDLASPVSVAGPQEIDQLARSFEAMRRNLSASRGELRRLAAELDERVNTRTREIAALSAIAQAANRHTEIGPLLDEALPLLTEITGAEAAWVTLLAEDIQQGNDSILEEERAAFTLAGAHNLPPALEADGRTEMRWTGCTCQRKLLNGELTAAVNILECQRLQQARGDTRGLRYHAAVPLRLGGQALGNLNLTTPLGRTFSDDELRLLTAVGDQIGVAIGRARLYARLKAQRIEEQAALLRLSQSLLGESDPQAIMDAAARMAADTLKVEFAAIALVDPEKQDFSGQAAIGWPQDLLQMAQRVPLSADTGLAYALRTRATVVIPDESRETRFGKPAWVTEAGIVSSMLAPMIVSGEVIGCLVVNSRARRDWNDDEARLLTLIASETSQALGRAWQHARAVERLERISALHDIDVAIVSHLDLQKRLDVLLEKVAERLRVDAAAVALIEPDSKELVYAARRGLDGEFFADGFLKVKEGIAGQVAHSGEAAAIPDVRAEPRFMRQEIAGRLGIVSYLAVPLRARGAIIGVLELATRARHEFLAEEMEFFITLAGQAAIALENARLFEEAHRRAAQQGALAETAGAILSTLQAEALWPAVTAAVRETLSAERAAVYLYDPAADRVACPHASGLSDEYVAEINHRFHEVPGGRLVSDPQPVVIADAQTDPATAPIHDLIIREGFHTYAVFPLTAPEGPLGALVAYRDLVAPFSPNDIATGRMLAHIVAVAIQNARLFKAERAARERAETLQQVGALLTTHLSLDEVFERLFDLLARVVAYDSVSVQLTDKDGSMYLAAGRGFPDLDRARKIVRDVQKKKLAKQRRWAEGRPQVIPDTHADSGWIVAPGVEYIRSWVGAPLLVKGELIGVLNVDSQTVNAYGQSTGETVMAFANQAAVAIENARLFDAERAAREQAELLREAAQAVSGTLNLDEVVRQILAQLKRVLAYDTASALLLGEAGKPTLVTGAGYVDEASTSRAASDLLAKSPILAQMTRDLKPVIIADVRDHPGWIWVPGAEHARSFLAVPIVTRERMIGALMMDSTHLDFFDKTHARLAQTLAQHMAVAIENARLFESLFNEQHNTAQLYHLSLELAADLEPEAVAKHALQAAAEAVGVQRGNILTLEEDGERLLLLAISGYDRETVDSLNRRLNWTASQGVTGRVVRTCKAAIVPEVARDADWVAIPGLDDWVQSMLSVPLVAGNKVVGALNLLSEQSDFFKAENLALVAAIASPVALALQNAGLYEGLQQRLKELEILADTSSALRKAQSSEDMPPILLDKAVKGLNANAGFLLLLENGELKFAAAHGQSGVSAGDICPPDATLMWQVLESGEPRFIPDITQRPEISQHAACRALMGDALSCVCAPLMIATNAIGVVFLNWKKKPLLSADELRLLEAIAEIAANALHRSTLHLQTERQALNLTLAYDTTIEGWSRALDLRDRETEGHTLRVTELTLELAREMDIPESALLHMRRGALLHDIGKMGVPDSILHKSGALSDEEWLIMRRHPQFAYDMLSHIAYLQPALEIPWRHHEKWDGSGYPRGLKGGEIPLAARIFAVADVFDALTFDRPYRPAWTKRKALAYIRRQAGIHFDPKVVETFLKLVG